MESRFGKRSSTGVKRGSIPERNSNDSQTRCGYVDSGCRHHPMQPPGKIGGPLVDTQAGGHVSGIGHDPLLRWRMLFWQEPKSIEVEQLAIQAEAGLRGELVELPDFAGGYAACHEAFPEI